MAEITAAAVMKLRKISGQGMMDCKKALGEANGDLDEAMTILRKKGLATMAKRAGRDTTEGRVVCKKSDDGKTVAMTMLCCETDFASKSDDFIEVAGKLADAGMICEADSGESIADVELDGKTMAVHLTDLISKTGEKTEIGDFARYTISGSGVIGAYVHFNYKTGALVEIETSSDEASAAIETVAAEIAMHVVAVNPAGVDRDTLDAEVVAKEREAAAESVKNKPAEIIDKIVDGKMNKFFGENCVVDQPFVKDDSITVEQAVSQAAKKGGGEAKIKRFMRFEIGS
jgi:elongation factor Ts